LCGCANASTPGSKPVSTTASLPDDGRGDTALTAYPIALVNAKKWNKDAVLYEIPVTQLMEKNLGLPPGVQAGWFFMFKVPGSPLEYYVKVAEGHVVGSTVAQPIIVGEPPFKEVALDLEKLPLGSNDVLRLFMEKGGSAYLASNPKWQLDYRLVHIEGQKDPVWSLFDSTDVNQAPLFNLDAITGEKVDDPFANLHQ
jgi:hypothetical protein